MARNAKVSSGPLATDVVAQSHTGDDSVAPRFQKSQTNPSGEDMIQATKISSSESLVGAIEKLGSNAYPTINGLWDEMKEPPCFDIDSLAHYCAYLVDNPSVTTKFKVLGDVQRKVWVSRHVKSTFPKAKGL
ncbi:hypothetical protein D1007_08525 [Hordeum vulgare]|nr:hypothetical protein D1007_08525 [Hordeum vulgare]